VGGTKAMQTDKGKNEEQSDSWVSTIETGRQYLRG